MDKLKLVEATQIKTGVPDFKPGESAYLNILHSFGYNPFDKVLDCHLGVSNIGL